MKRGRSAAGDFRVAHNIADDLTVALQARDWTPADSDGDSSGGCGHSSWKASGGCRGECMYIIIMTKLACTYTLKTHVRGGYRMCHYSDTHRQTKYVKSCNTDPVSTKARQTRDRVIGSRAADTFCIIM